MTDIQCPFCGDSREADSDDYGEDGSAFIEECGHCDKKYQVSLSISHSWSTCCAPGTHVLKPNPRHEGWFDCENCDEFLQAKDNVEEKD